MLDASAIITHMPSILARSTAAGDTTSASKRSMLATSVTGIQAPDPTLRQEAHTEIQVMRARVHPTMEVDGMQMAVFVDEHQDSFWSAWRFWRTAYSGATRVSYHRHGRTRVHETYLRD